MRILGCDPGLTGALALHDTVEGVLTLHDTPVNHVRTSSRKERDEIDAAALASLVRDLCPDVAVVEQVGAMPGQGVTSMFRFGYSFGVLLGVLSACGVATHLVVPQVWRRRVRVPAGKDGSRLRAGQLFPRNANEFRRVKDHGRADAALVAFYGGLTLDNPF